MSDVTKNLITRSHSEAPLRFFESYNFNHFHFDGLVRIQFMMGENLITLSYFRNRKNHVSDNEPTSHVLSARPSFTLCWLWALAIFVRSISSPVPVQTRTYPAVCKRKNIPFELLSLSCAPQNINLLWNRKNEWFAIIIFNFGSRDFLLRSLTRLEGDVC